MGIDALRVGFMEVEVLRRDVIAYFQSYICTNKETEETQNNKLEQYIFDNRHTVFTTDQLYNNTTFLLYLRTNVLHGPVFCYGPRSGLWHMRNLNIETKALCRVCCEAFQGLQHKFDHAELLTLSIRKLKGHLNSLPQKLNTANGFMVLSEALTFLLDNTYFRFGSKLHGKIVGIPMGTYCAPLVVNLVLFCYERDLMLSLSDDNQFDVIEAFNSTSRYLDGLLNIDNNFFDSTVNRIDPSELQCNKTNVSDTETSSLYLHLSISDDFVNTKIYDKRDDFDFDIVIFLIISKR